MAITQGLNTSNVIELSAGTSSRIITALKIEYSWEPVGRSIEEAINGNLTEDYYDSRLCIDVVIIPERYDSTSIYVDTNWLLNQFLPSTDKKYKESGWASSIDIVLDMKNVKIANWKNNRNRGYLTLKFKKKTPGLS